jgi:hypothetical protein
MSVVEPLELSERVDQVALVPDQVRSSSSQRQVCIQRSVIAFIRGHLGAGEHDADPGISQHSIESGGELAVWVSDHEPVPRC